jgi:Ca2+-binding EF-hand superfamily protein
VFFFHQVKTQACKQRDIDTIVEQFQALDVDGSGFLNADDFKKMAEHKQRLRMGGQAVQSIL